MKSGYGVRRFIHEGQAGVNYLEAQIGKMDRGAIDVVDRASFFVSVSLKPVGSDLVGYFPWFKPKHASPEGDVAGEIRKAVRAYIRRTRGNAG